MKIFTIQYYCGDEYSCSWYENLMYFMNKEDCDFACEVLNTEILTYKANVLALHDKEAKEAKVCKSAEKQNTRYTQYQKLIKDEMQNLLNRISEWGVVIENSRIEDFEATVSSREEHDIYSVSSREISELTIYQNNKNFLRFFIHRSTPSK